MRESKRLLMQCERFGVQFGLYRRGEVFHVSEEGASASEFVEMSEALRDLADRIDEAECRSDLAEEVGSDE